MADADPADDQWVPEMLQALLAAYSSLVASLSLTALRHGASKAEVRAEVERLLGMMDEAMPSEQTKRLFHKQLDWIVESLDRM